ncbi:hypothetical protein B0H13DRAFT_1929447 [Mycena leptocephala]|nr:hypothetical protein B0H13DRAFT_1929447 [Mycena leptocephala]
MLANSDDGRPLEVFLVMRKAPIKWSTILVLENIRSSEELYDKVKEHDEELVESVRGRSPEMLIASNLISTLVGNGLIAPDAASMISLLPVTQRREARHVKIEEVEDEYWEMEARMPKATKGILEAVEDDSEEVEAEERKSDAMEEEVLTNVGEDEARLPLPPPKDAEMVVLRPRQRTKPGDSAIGISVLSVRGRIGSLDSDDLDLRLDSCADITLLSEEFYKQMRSPPPIKQGRKMSLAQLTDGGTTIKGYTKLKVFLSAISGETIEAEVEAYVVKGMSVPILLGEDFQLNYELGIARNVEEGTRILFKGTPYEVEATGVEPFAGRAETHCLATNLTTFAKDMTKAKQHRRAKMRRRRRVLRNGAEGKTICASEDYKIKAHKCRIVRVDGDFSQDREWLVERNLLANAEDSFFSIPNTLISARKPTVPVSNMSDRPRFIRKGEILGTLTDPQEYFDKPGTPEGYREQRPKWIAVAQRPDPQVPRIEAARTIETHTSVRNSGWEFLQAKTT